MGFQNESSCDISHEGINEACKKVPRYPSINDPSRKLLIKFHDDNRYNLDNSEYVKHFTTGQGSTLATSLAQKLLLFNIIFLEL